MNATHIVMSIGLATALTASAAVAQTKSSGSTSSGGTPSSHASSSTTTSSGSSSHTSSGSTASPSTARTSTISTSTPASNPPISGGVLRTAVGPVMPQAAPAPARVGEQPNPDRPAISDVKEKMVTTPLIVPPSAPDKSGCPEGPTGSWRRGWLEGRK